MKAADYEEQARKVDAMAGELQRSGLTKAATMLRMLGDLLRREADLSVTLADVSGAMNRAVREEGGQARLATKLGISRSFLNDVMSAKRSHTPAMLEYLGFKRIQKFQRIRNPNPMR